jgi:hypothetical protein
MTAVNDVEARDCYIGDCACSSERSEGPVMDCLPAEWPGPPQAKPPPIVSIETILVR